VVPSGGGTAQAAPPPPLPAPPAARLPAAHTRCTGAEGLYIWLQSLPVTTQTLPVRSAPCRASMALLRYPSLVMIDGTSWDERREKEGGPKGHPSGSFDCPALCLLWPCCGTQTH
jgi:hypothetical protein